MITYELAVSFDTWGKAWLPSLPLFRSPCVTQTKKQKQKKSRASYTYKRPFHASITGMRLQGRQTSCDIDSETGAHTGLKTAKGNSRTCSFCYAAFFLLSLLYFWNRSIQGQNFKIAEVYVPLDSYTWEVESV